jgi:hypothetical protein
MLVGGISIASINTYGLDGCITVMFTTADCKRRKSYLEEPKPPTKKMA